MLLAAMLGMTLYFMQLGTATPADCGIMQTSLEAQLDYAEVVLDAEKEEHYTTIGIMSDCAGFMMDCSDSNDSLKDTLNEVCGDTDGWPDGGI